MDSEIHAACEQWDTTVAGTVEHEVAAAKVVALVQSQPEPRTWLFGLTADEWLHLTSEGDKSEVPPCCGNIGQIRDNLRMFVWFQGADDTNWQKMAGGDVLAAVEADGDQHGLQDREGYPLLHRVLDGIRKQLAETSDP